MTTTEAELRGQFKFKAHAPGGLAGGEDDLQEGHAINRSAVAIEIGIPRRLHRQRMVGKAGSDHGSCFVALLERRAKRR